MKARRSLLALSHTVVNAGLLSVLNPASFYRCGLTVTVLSWTLACKLFLCLFPFSKTSTKHFYILVSPWEHWQGTIDNKSSLTGMVECKSPCGRNRTLLEPVLDPGLFSLFTVGWGLFILFIFLILSGYLFLEKNWIEIEMEQLHTFQPFPYASSLVEKPELRFYLQ